MTETIQAVQPVRRGRPIPGPRGNPLLGSIRDSGIL